ncbi:hypothetical protein B0O80DRAFT_98167 [Mortierella sp. GBAus27b]|nr:hypothetical protein B0O80DRAFT_98167 [Mortierella sp. GBAus27b]
MGEVSLMACDGSVVDEDRGADDRVGLVVCLLQAERGPWESCYKCEGSEQSDLRRKSKTPIRMQVGGRQEREDRGEKRVREKSSDGAKKEKQAAHERGGKRAFDVTARTELSLLARRTLVPLLAPAFASPTHTQPSPMTDSMMHPQGRKAQGVEWLRGVGSSWAALNTGQARRKARPRPH